MSIISVRRTYLNVEQLIGCGLLTLGESVVIEEGVILCHPDRTGAQLPVTIGNHCHLAAGSIIYSGATLGDYCQVGHYTVIGANAQVGQNTHIGHHCVVGDNVKLGTDNILYPSTVITGEVEIGSGNSIGPFASIGTLPQHVRIQEANGLICIGNNNVFREYTVVHAPTRGLTQVGNRCYIMVHNRIAHDVIIGDYVNMSSQCSVSGTVTIMHHAVLGTGSVIHQESVIGAGAMLGMGSIVTKDVPPYVIFYAGKAQRLNLIGMQRMGRSETEIQDLAVWYSSDKKLPLCERLQSTCGAWWHQDFLAFIEKSHRNICDLGNL